MTVHQMRVRRAERRRGITLFELIAVIVVLVILGAMLLPATRNARPAARRTQCKNNLKQIALALRNYESEYHAFPPAYTVDANGKPLHSWRTLILPFLEQSALYDTIDLSKPWDDPANAQARETEVLAYQCPENLGQKNHTTYLVVVAPGSCFRRELPTALSEVTDNPSETLLVVEVESEHSVPWMAPQDADLDLILGLSPQGSLPHEGGFQAAFVDGTVRFLEATTPADQRRALISIGGMEPAQFASF